MTQPHRITLRILALLVVAGGLMTSCTDETIVFRDRVLFEDPPEGSGAFIGYTEEADKLTVCGNCHVGQQAEWELTGHADAWDGLQASGGAQAFCEGCHTTNDQGNSLDVASGYNAVQDSRYHDVQCEACHGPGLEHVTNPDASQPIASIAVGSDPAVGCAECHSGNHHPFIQEWEASKHSGVVSFAAGREDCAGCHRGQGALQAFGVRDEYLEKDAAEHQPIVCAVCHDPHDGTFDGQLRFPVQTTDVSLHLCARCHDRRTNPDPNSSHGLEPHSPETALLEGEAGWFPPGADIDQGLIRASHGSEANGALCATCHVVSFTVTDQETGDFIFNSTGHMFTAIPCVDAQGVPQAGDCDLDGTSRTFAGCEACHDLAVIPNILRTIAQDILNDAETLHTLLLAVDPNLEAAGGEIDPTDPTFTTAEGAFFNYALAVFPGADRVDPLMRVAGSTVHNPFLMRALLAASIVAVQDAYP
ncbi:MAG: multiheme c-type cytochrome [Gemmatimonadota bacterium]